MPKNYRHDPFQDVLNPVTIKGETQTIPSVSPFTIRLDEVPLKETPSSISLTIGGVAAEEVSSAPAPGQFWPDYSTGADNDENWNTGTILFNAADAGKTVVVTYKGTGCVVWGEIDTLIITSSCTIRAPLWATAAVLSGCAGGGGGGGDRSNTYSAAGGAAGGGAIDFVVPIAPGANYRVIIGAGGVGGAGNASGSVGGTTSFGHISSSVDLLKLGGGEGGFYAYSTYLNQMPAIGSGYLTKEHYTDAGLVKADAVGNGWGGSGPWGEGGAAPTAFNSHGNDGTGYGSGGSGALSNTGSGTIYYTGGKGAPGILYVRWVA